MRQMVTKDIASLAKDAVMSRRHGHSSVDDLVRVRMLRWILDVLDLMQSLLEDILDEVRESPSVSVAQLRRRNSKSSTVTHDCSAHTHIAQNSCVISSTACAPKTA